MTSAKNQRSRVSDTRDLSGEGKSGFRRATPLTERSREEAKRALRLAALLFRLKTLLSLLNQRDTMTPDEVLEWLKKGNEAYVRGEAVIKGRDPARWEKLKEGQSPNAVVVACSDSRVNPLLIFNANDGDIFTIETAGNVVDQLAIESILYAVEHLNTPLLLVLGHQSCGAVTEITKAFKDEERWEEVKATALGKLIAPAVVKAEGDLDRAIHLNVENVIKTLMEVKAIKEKVEKGELKVVGGYFSFETGKVEFFEV